MDSYYKVYKMLLCKVQTNLCLYDYEGHSHTLMFIRRFIHTPYTIHCTHTQTHTHTHTHTHAYSLSLSLFLSHSNSPSSLLSLSPLHLFVNAFHCLCLVSYKHVHSFVSICFFLHSAALSIPLGSAFRDNQDTKYSVQL